MAGRWAIEWLMLAGAVLLLASIVASKASGRLGVPALVLFLAIGMLAGSDGLGGIYFDDAWLAQALGVMALVLILFSGGLDTDWNRVRPVLWRGIALSTVGVLLTTGAVGLFAVAVLRFPLLQGLLLGAIVSSTDAAAVFTVLRSRSVRLRDHLESLLELESGSNDPMAVFLTLGLIGLINEPAASFLGLLPMFVRQMALAGAIGYLGGRTITLIVNRIRLQVDGLYPALTLALVFLVYGATAVLGGNGFLAVFLAGLVMGRSDFLHRRSLLRFHDALAWLMQIVMFLVLGLLVFPSRLLPLAGVGLLSAAFLILVARPVSVLLTLAPARMAWREKVTVAWVGLRGAAPIILATFPRLAGIPQAELLFDIVFFIVLASVLVQGMSIPLVARHLGVDVPAPPRHGPPLEIAPAAQLNSALTELTVSPGSHAAGRQVLALSLPPGALIVLIGRDGEHMVPDGSTVLQPGDRLLVLAGRPALAQVREILERRET